MTTDDIASSQYSGFEPSTGLLRFISNVTGAHIDATVEDAGPIVSVLCFVRPFLTSSTAYQQ